MPTSRSEIFQALLKKYGNKCQSCGAEGADLQIDHIVPLSKGGRHELDNLTLLCPRCNRFLGAFLPSGLEFERFLSDILTASPHYMNVVAQNPLPARGGTRLRPDFAVTRLENGKRQRLVIEAKAWSSPRKRHVQAAIEQIRTYRTVGSFDAAALAFPGRLTESDKALFHAAAVEIWDLDLVATLFADEIEAQPFSKLRQLYTLKAHTSGLSESAALIEQLKACSPGADWIRYQKLIANVLEYLFTPPLMRPIWESSDAPRANRRDIILPNYATDGFWKFMRETYDAHYIVVDAKNYKGKITKPQALQLANYLKPHGTGMFGIIATRVGASPACSHTLTEQWIFARKMIVLLSDKDIERMLLAVSSRGKPEDIIGQKIEDFRLRCNNHNHRGNTTGNDPNFVPGKAIPWPRASHATTPVGGVLGIAIVCAGNDLPAPSEPVRGES